MNALITKMKMGEHEHDEAVNVDELADMNVNI